jgi:hypothetical protein
LIRVRFGQGGVVEVVVVDDDVGFGFRVDFGQISAVGGVVVGGEGGAGLVDSTERGGVAGAAPVLGGVEVGVHEHDDVPVRPEFGALQETAVDDQDRLCGGENRRFVGGFVGGRSMMRCR